MATANLIKSIEPISSQAGGITSLRVSLSKRIICNRSWGVGFLQVKVYKLI
jgi:hypothetical protein